MVIWITGKANSGKTTLARNLIDSLCLLKAVLLDGDNVRKYFPTGYSDDERHEHIMRIAKFAALLEEQGYIPVITLVSPRKEWRQEARQLFKQSAMIYVPGGELWEGTTFDEPDFEEMGSSGIIYSWKLGPEAFSRVKEAVLNMICARNG